MLGNIITPAWHDHSDAGVQFAKQRLLRLGIMPYGFRLTFQQVGDVGASGVIIDVLMLSSTFLLACALGLTTRICALGRARLRPVLLALVLFIWLMAGGALVNMAVQRLMA